MPCARPRSSAISNLLVTRNSRSSLTSCSAYSARSCDRVILPLTILNVKLARMVSMSSLIDSICFGGGGDGSGDGDGDTDGDGEGDLDLLRDEDGKSDGGGEDDDVKSDGGSEDDDVFDGSSG
ncbi:hypothetical protein Tco_0718358 [Tanacetum coccineum]